MNCKHPPIHCKKPNPGHFFKQLSDTSIDHFSHKNPDTRKFQFRSWRNIIGDQSLSVDEWETKWHFPSQITHDSPHFGDGRYTLKELHATIHLRFVNILKTVAWKFKEFASQIRLRNLAPEPHVLIFHFFLSVTHSGFSHDTLKKVNFTELFFFGQECVEVEDEKSANYHKIFGKLTFKMILTLPETSPPRLYEFSIRHSFSVSNTL